MAISSDLSKKNKVARKKNESRSNVEQRALEGRCSNIYKYLRERNVTPDDLELLHLSWLWLYCDPRRELDVDKFMNLTESQIHDRFDGLKSKNHIKKLISFEKVIELYAVEDNCVKVPYRYAV